MIYGNGDARERVRWRTFQCKGGDSSSGKGIEVKVKVAYIYGHHCFGAYSYMVSWMTQASKGEMADIPV